MIEKNKDKIQTFPLSTINTSAIKMDTLNWPWSFQWQKTFKPYSFQEVKFLLAALMNQLLLTVTIITTIIIIIVEFV